MLCAAVPLIFGTLRGLSPVVSVLPFVSIFIGILFGGGFIILDQRRYAAHLRRKGVGSDPEERFKPMALGAVMLREWRCGWRWHERGVYEHGVCPRVGA
jgi:hypothetical protein